MTQSSHLRRAFHDTSYDLGANRAGRHCTLDRLERDEAETLGAAFAAMDPWAAYGTAASRLAGFFAQCEEGCSRHAIRVDRELAGVVVVRAPWLHGPYLHFLGLVPGQTASGTGALVLHWLEREAPPDTRNLWLCVSAINARASTFYERHGFEHAATLDGLAADHMDELLMRKRLAVGHA